MRIKWYYFLKIFFRPNYEFFSAQNHKAFKVGKIGKIYEKGLFFRKKKRFRLFKSLLYKNGKAAKSGCSQPSCSATNKLVITFEIYKEPLFSEKKMPAICRFS